MAQIEIGTKVWVRSSGSTYQTEGRTVEKIYKNGKVKLSGWDGMWTVTRWIEQREGTWTLTQPRPGSAYRGYYATTDEQVVARANDLNKRRMERLDLLASIRGQLAKLEFDNDHTNSDATIRILRTALSDLTINDESRGAL